jgi:formiminoglutamase
VIGGFVLTNQINRFLSMSVPSDDVRICEGIKKGDIGDIVLIGFPYDEGVRRNGGRLGACGGPSAIRKYFSRIGTIINPEFGYDAKQVKIVDAGDIEPGLELEKAHELLTTKVSQVIKSGGIPFVIGGGNDQSFPNALGMLLNRDRENCGVINIDAHFDVRPKKNGLVHSGSPFRMLLETEGFLGKNFVEFASQGVQCSNDHFEYLKEKGASVHWLSQIQKYGVVDSWKQVLKKQPDNVFVSFDIDSVQSSDVPGVSCPALIGLTAQEALDICFESGRNPKVVLFDVSEFNPLIEEYRTARFVGYMLAYFAYGVSERFKSQK